MFLNVLFNTNPTQSELFSILSGSIAPALLQQCTLLQHSVIQAPDTTENLNLNFGSISRQNGKIILVGLDS